MASNGYQMTGGLADLHGRITEIGHAGPVVVIIRVTGDGVLYLDAAKREEFQRLFMEAERQAEAAEVPGGS